MSFMFIVGCTAGMVKYVHCLAMGKFSFHVSLLLPNSSHTPRTHRGVRVTRIRESDAREAPCLEGRRLGRTVPSGKAPVGGPQ